LSANVFEFRLAIPGEILAINDMGSVANKQNLGFAGTLETNLHKANKTASIEKTTTKMEVRMNATKMSREIKIDDCETDKQGREVSRLERDLNTTKSALNTSQRAAICFAAGVVGALAVVVFSYVLFALGLSATLGVKAPIPLKSPDIYKPLFWGGLWGILFGLLIKRAWNRLYLAGFLYVLAPLLALFLFFLPMSGAGYFGLHLGPAFTVYLLLVNLPFGIVTALTAKAIIGKHP